MEDYGQEGSDNGIGSEAVEGEKLAFRPGMVASETCGESVCTSR
eukprot:SAG31_NODE_16720_length_698_cov_1.829716_1_plen_44_part_00